MSNWVAEWALGRLGLTPPVLLPHVPAQAATSTVTSVTRWSSLLGGVPLPHYGAALCKHKGGWTLLLSEVSCTYVESFQGALGFFSTIAVPLFFFYTINPFAPLGPVYFPKVCSLRSKSLLPGQKLLACPSLWRKTDSYLLSFGKEYDKATYAKGHAERESGGNHLSTLFIQKHKNS